MSWLYLGIAVIFEITVAISAGNAKGQWCNRNLFFESFATDF